MGGGRGIAIIPSSSPTSSSPSSSNFLSLSFFLPFFTSSDFTASFLKLAATVAGSTLPTKGIPVLFTGTPRGHPTNTFSGFRSVWIMPHTRCK
eukprot:Skav215940  [mRNA]  locus=scaffold226:623024:624245:- [translate_table: standard]